MTVPFVIVCPMRTGSNLLVSILRSHPAIEIGGELFHRVHRDIVQWADPEIRHDAELIALRERDPVAFLAELRHRVASRPEVGAFGFKLLHNHAKQEPAVVAALRANTELRVVFLDRRNLLRRLLSHERARVSDQWAAKLGSKPERPPPVTLEVKQCLDDFAQTEADAAQMRAWFTAQPGLALTYEELAADPVGTGGRVVSFLDLPPAELSYTEKKTGTDPLAEAISNFDELRGTLLRWASFCEE